MSTEANGPLQPFPKLPDAAPDALRQLYERMVTFAQEPHVQRALMELADNHYNQRVPVSGVDGVGVTHAWVQWLNSFEVHARTQLEMWQIVDGAEQYLRRERDQHNSGSSGGNEASS